MLSVGILEYFELISSAKDSKGINIFLEEKIIVPEENKDQLLYSKGFLPEIQVHDFPIRGYKVALCVKRRRWKVQPTGEVVTRNWTLVRAGARMTTEFVFF